jgi:hypothetical protein
MAVALPATLEQPGTGVLARARITLADGASTAVYAVAHPPATTELRVAVLRRPERLEPWCASRGVPDAIVGGFFVRPQGVPLGELRTRGVTRRHVAFAAPWAAVRACVHVEGGEVRLAQRDELPARPRGDLLQAGPLLVRQFDSDITDGRHPRAALGIAPGRLLALVCDGRSRRDAGLTLEELARLMADLGCHTAINLDGGGSTSLISGGRLRNHPYAGVDRPEPGGRPVSTALLFVPR